MPAPLKNHNAAIVPGQVKDAMVILRVHPGEKSAWVRAAHRSPQRTLVAWIRNLLNANS